MGARVLVVDDSPTIRKVVCAILERHAFSTDVAEDGQVALERLRAERADLVLLDFVMPRMNGYQFCRELRADAALKDLPVVLMSAKGDKIRGHFVQQTGAIDAITKPFDSMGLLAVVEGALRRHATGATRPAIDADAMADEDTLADSPPSGVSRPDSSRMQSAVFDSVQSEVLEVLRPLVSGRGDAVAALRAGLDREVLRQLSRALERAAGPTDESRAALAGDLSVISIAEILQLLALQRQSGTLTLVTTRGGRQATVNLYVNSGNLDLAESTGLPGEFRLGRHFVEVASLSRSKLEEVASARTGPELLGDRLVAQGLVSREQKLEALRRQTAELVYELVRWRSGRFSFRPNVTSPTAAEAALGLPTGGLVMEGFRRFDEWRLIEGSFDFDEVLYPDAAAIHQAEADGLTEQERSIVRLIDGERTVREIMQEVEASSFVVCKILFQLLKSRVVRRSTAGGRLTLTGTGTGTGSLPPAAGSVPPAATGSDT